MRQDDPNYPFLLEQIIAEMQISLELAIKLLRALEVSLHLRNEDLFAAEKLINESIKTINDLRIKNNITPEGIDLSSVPDYWAAGEFTMRAKELLTDGHHGVKNKLEDLDE